MTNFLRPLMGLGCEFWGNFSMDIAREPGTAGSKKLVGKFKKCSWANHVRALEHGLARLADRPISTRLLCELHGILISEVRGGYASKSPGELRRSHNWIGKAGAMIADASFVAPPPEAMGEALGDWERYLHSESQEPAIVKAALLH